MITGLTITVTLMVFVLCVGRAYAMGQDRGYADAIRDVQRGDFDFTMTGRPPSERR